jgi:hypothetical protein
MTPEQILSATGPELSKMLGEVLQPEVKHHVLNAASNSCRNCKKELYTYSGRSTEALQQDCDIATPIPLTWPEAMKYAKRIMNECGLQKFINALVQVVLPGEGNAPNKVKLEMVVLAEPEDWMKAAALCVIKENK